ncbi:MAG: DUF6788 family protein [Acidimicrobiales bacterium]
MATQLERYEARHRTLAAQLASLGFICPGSLIERETSCGKPGCRCMGDPPRRHGPYFQWSRAVAGKTLTRRLSADEAELYREWVGNWREMKRIIDEMEEVSAAAGEILLRQAARNRPSKPSAT